MGSSVVISKEAQERIQKSKHKHKVMESLNNYGFKHGAELREWCEENVSQNYKSVTITNYSQPSYRNNRDDLVEALNSAWSKEWRLYLLQFTDVVDVQKNEVVTSMVKWTGPKSGEYNKYYEIYHKFDAIFNKQSGLWLRSAYKQFIPDKNLLKQYPHFVSIGKTRPILNVAAGSPKVSSSYGSSNYGTSSTYNESQQSKKRQQQNANRSKQQRDRWQKDSKSREDQRRRQEEKRRQDQRRQQQRQAEQSRRRAAQQARQRDQRYRQQQRQHQENMRRQEQAQRDYQNQQRQIAQQRHRQYQTALSKRNNY